MTGVSARFFCAATPSKYLKKPWGGRQNEDERGRVDGHKCFSYTVGNMLPSGLFPLSILNPLFLGIRNRKKTEG